MPTVTSQLLPDSTSDQNLDPAREKMRHLVNMSSSAASAISASELRIRPTSKSHRSSFSSTSSTTSQDVDTQEVASLIDKLLTTPNKSIYDPSVAGTIQQLKNRLLFLDEPCRYRLNERLRNKWCPSYTTLTPETVGAYICGCFMNSSAYGTLQGNCTALCAGSALAPSGTAACSQTVLHWMRDPITGQAVSHHQSGKSPNCNVFVDQGVNVTAEQKYAFLAQAGCRTASYYNANTNTPLLQDQANGQANGQAAGYQPAQPVAPNVQVTPSAQNFPPSSQSTVMAAFTVQNPSTGVATGAAGTAAPQSYSAGGVSLWITFAIIIFILIVLVVLFAMWRYSAWY